MQAGKGNSVAQYGIIIVLVAIAGIGVFTSLGQNILNQLSNFAAMMANNNAIVSQNASGSSAVANVTPGSLGGTPSNPVTVSNGDGTSVIDFGDYILDGIPENFDEFIESNGTSGGTDKLAAIYSQVAEQLEEQGNEDAANQFKDLAALAGFMSDIQKEVETAASGCGDDLGCFKDAIKNDDAVLDVPDEVKDLLTGFDAKTSLYDAMEQLDLGAAANAQTGFLSIFNSSNDNIGEKMYTILEDINKNPDISDALKSTTNLLYTEMGETGFEQIGQAEANSLPFISKMLSKIGIYKHEKDEYSATEGEYIETEEFTVGNEITTASEGSENLAEEIIEEATNEAASGN